MSKDAKVVIGIVGGATFIAFAIGLLLLTAVASTKDLPDKNRASVMCHEGVSHKLKAPASADYPFDMDTVNVHGKPYVYTLDSYVDSQNSFGAKMRQKFHCEATEAGDHWNVNVTFPN